MTQEYAHCGDRNAVSEPSAGSNRTGKRKLLSPYRLLFGFREPYQVPDASSSRAHSLFTLVLVSAAHIQ